MAAFFTDAVGVLSGLRINEADEQQNPIPGNALYTLRFDETTNGGLITDYSNNSNAFAMPAGTLTKNGTPATINPPSAYYTAVAELPSVLAKLDGPDPLTTGELASALRVLLHDAGRA